MKRSKSFSIAGQRGLVLAVVGAVALIGACSKSPSEEKKPETAAPAAPAAAPAAAAKAEAAKPLPKELNLFAWSEYVPQGVIDGFQKETGIKVNYETYASNEEMLAKLVSGATRYDLIQPSEYTIEALVNEKLGEYLEERREVLRDAIGRGFRAEAADADLAQPPGEDAAGDFDVPGQRFLQP